MAELAELGHAAPIDSQHTRFGVVKFVTLIIFVTNTEDSETGAAVDE